ncbi:hypothetical protein [Aeromonas dhakensis]|uniref:hypothetical protein n=1 Tax=Aeromonas dhakensis TaxID=196024 RepID=UPI00288FF3EB|nr:hypothetical protein [Aeromonas dhakensis]
MSHDITEQNINGDSSLMLLRSLRESIVNNPIDNIDVRLISTIFNNISKMDANSLKDNSLVRLIKFCINVTLSFNSIEKSIIALRPLLYLKKYNVEKYAIIKSLLTDYDLTVTDINDTHKYLCLRYLDIKIDEYPLSNLAPYINTLDTNLVMMALHDFSLNELVTIQDGLNILNENKEKHSDISVLIDHHIKNIKSHQSVPKSLPRVKNPRIALCLSGQMRGYVDAFKSWQHSKLLKQYSVDIYISTWDKMGRKFPSIQHAHRTFGEPFLSEYISMLNSSSMSTLEEKYPNFFTFLTQSDLVDLNDVHRVYSPRLKKLKCISESSVPFDLESNQMKMFYQIQECFNLIEDNYDIIIRCRPDKPIQNDAKIDWDNIFSVAIENDILFSDVGTFIHPYAGYGMGDQFALGNSRTMKVYSSSFLSLQNEQCLARKIYPPYYPHNSLAAHLAEQKIVIDTIPELKFWSLRDPVKFSDNDILSKIMMDINSRTEFKFDSTLISALAL